MSPRAKPSSIVGSLCTAKADNTTILSYSGPHSRIHPPGVTGNQDGRQLIASRTRARTLPTLGWREWVGLPELGISRLKAKVDTGARSSTLHAYFVEPFEEDGRRMVRFGLHPRRKHTRVKRICTAAIADERTVSDSGGHRERRIVIVTPVVLGTERWSIEVTLTARDSMLYRMLLGRTAIRGRYLVDSDASWLAGRPVDTRSPRNAE